MIRYFMHLRDGTDELLDPEGSEYESLDALRTAVLATVRDLMAGDMRNGVLDFRFRVDAEDAGRHHRLYAGLQARGEHHTGGDRLRLSSKLA